VVAAGTQVGQPPRDDRLAVHPHLAVQDDQGVLEGGLQRPVAPAGGHGQVDPDQLAVAPGRGGGAGEAADQDGPGAVVQLDPGELGVVLEGGGAVAGPLRLGDPQLDAVQLATVAGALLGVGDAVAGRHQVELAGPDELLGAEAVAVQHLARQQPGDGLEAGVGVGADLQAGRPGDRHGAEVVGEAPGPDGAALAAGEGAPHRDAADVGDPARGDLDAGRRDRARPGLGRRRVSRGDRTAHPLTLACGPAGVQRPRG
jgi:hypothetical protein